MGCFLTLLSLFINFTLPWFFFALTNPQVMQRLFIPKDERSLREMIVYFGLFIFSFLLFFATSAVENYVKKT